MVIVMLAFLVVVILETTALCVISPKNLGFLRGMPKKAGVMAAVTKTAEETEAEAAAAIMAAIAAKVA